MQLGSGRRAVSYNKNSMKSPKQIRPGPVVIQLDGFSQFFRNRNGWQRFCLGAFVATISAQRGRSGEEVRATFYYAMKTYQQYTAGAVQSGADSAYLHAVC